MRSSRWLRVPALAALVIGGGTAVGCSTGSTLDSTSLSSGSGGGSSTSSHATGSTTSSSGAGTGGETASSSSSSASSGSSGGGGAGTGGAGGAGGGGGGGGSAPVGFPLGTDCNVDADCQSSLCKPVVIDHNPVCVSPCTQPSDCGASTDFFCEPITAGGTDGYCIPHSPAHCLTCTQDSDCGSLSEVCFQAPGDNIMACHIDCSIDGDDACPLDYSCTDQTVAGQARRLCRPKGVATCLDALGGFCDRLTVPQNCARANTAGTCLGQRSCLAAGKRFDKCDATAPACKADCSATDPAGCMETFCPSAVSTPTNCGTCGTVCPGYLKTADNVTCQNSATCTFSCQGENYDVDNDPSNGCEVADVPTGNHSKSSAADEGSVSDCDSNFSFSGKIVSDARVHETPAIVGFDAASGSAPDWYTFKGVGHTFCENNVVVSLQINGSANPTCYKFTIITDKNTYTCQTNAAGTCGFNASDSGQFSDDTQLYAEIQKTCGTTVRESVTYTVSGHL